MVRSRWGPNLILACGGVSLINTETLEVTALGNSLGFNFVQESATDPAIWYAVKSPPGSAAVIGTYDYKKALWSAKATVQPRAGDWGVSDFAAVADGSKAYLAVLGPWLPNYEATGWLYAVDLQNGEVKELPIDGGAVSLTVGNENNRLYVGVGWPARAVNSLPMIHVIDTSRDTDIGVINVGTQKFGRFCSQLNEMKIDPANGRLLYATDADGNSFFKVDLATGQVIEDLVMNDESNSPHMIVRRPGTSRAYVLLWRTNEALEIDLDRAEVIRTVQFPLTGADLACTAWPSGTPTRCCWRRVVPSWNWPPI